MNSRRVVDIGSNRTLPTKVSKFLSATRPHLLLGLGGDVVETAEMFQVNFSEQAMRELNQLPLPKHITFHSIIGDKGKGNSLHSSDGVVPYWSSHVGPVSSELIVPSNHSVPCNIQAASEIRRILFLHLKEEGKLKSGGDGSTRVALPAKFGAE